jgi:hypothetical protein
VLILQINIVIQFPRKFLLIAIYKKLWQVNHAFYCYKYWKLTNQNRCYIFGCIILIILKVKKKQQQNVGKNKQYKHKAFRQIGWMWKKVFSILSLFQIRWVVESANARIQNFKWLDRVLPTNQVPFIGDYVRIVCAISNRYFPALGRTVNEDDDIQLAREMQQKSTEVLQLCPFLGH